MANTRQFDDEQWREQLTPDEFRICRQKGTEPPFSGAYCDEKTPGIYHCKCCHQPLFDAAAKYDSGSGWPSFYQAMDVSIPAMVCAAPRSLVRTVAPIWATCLMTVLNQPDCDIV